MPNGTTTDTRWPVIVAALVGGAVGGAIGGYAGAQAGSNNNGSDNTSGALQQQEQAKTSDSHA
ncbi:MAG: hypothetical protein ACJ8OJ_06305 [Povalibacter sp.]